MKAEHFELILRVLDAEIGREEYWVEQTRNPATQKVHRKRSERAQKARDAFIEEVRPWPSTKP